jgi:electron transport complex protein RnfD
MGVYNYGLPALWVILTASAAAVASELIWQAAAKNPIRINDLSALVTGLLLGLTLPPAVPLWIAAVGSAFSIIVVKQFFGGLGCNFMNPALAGRAMLLVSWPAAEYIRHTGRGRGFFGHAAGPCVLLDRSFPGEYPRFHRRGQ